MFMTKARKSHSRAQEYRTLAEGYKMLESPLARRYQMAAEALEQVQFDQPVAERSDALVAERRRDPGEIILG